MTLAASTTQTTEKGVAGNLAGRRVLFIAYFFPPTVSTGVPGSQRTIKFLRNLSNGECHVLTVTETVKARDNALRHLSLPVNGEIIHRVAPWDIFKALLSLRMRVKGLFRSCSDRSEASEVPATAHPTQAVFRSENDARNIRSAFQKLKDFVYDLCYFPDQAGPWILPATRYAKKLVRRHGIDLIFATGSPWSGLLTGYLVSKATGKPLIVDFRDPWMDNPFHQSKGRFLDNWASKLERKVVTHAAAVSLNTPPLRDAFIARYPGVPTERFFVMPNGFDLKDFPEMKHRESNLDTLTLCHAGFLYGVRDPSALLDAIQKANNQLAAQGKKICFQQIGDVQLSYDLESRYGNLVADGALKLEPARPYQECLKALSQADIVVNIQPATKSQVPSKLYDYLAINRPILNITPPDGALGRMVNEHGLGEQFDFSDIDTIADRLVSLAQGTEREAIEHFCGYPNRKQFDASQIAAKFAERAMALTTR